MEVFPMIPIANVIAIILVLMPSSWHWKAKNTGTLIFIAWTLIGNLNLLVNTIIWRGTVEDLHPIWCTISIKLVVGNNVGLVMACLCINRKLYNIATIQSVSITAEAKRRGMIADIFLGAFLPLLAMALHYTVQPNRYQIIEDVGCWPTVQMTLAAIPMVYIWPILISVASFLYSMLSIRGFLKARRQFNQVLNNSGSGINMSRYFRLMGLAGQEMLVSLPLSCYALSLNLQRMRQWPWISWEETHSYFTTVPVIPMAALRMNPIDYRGVMLSLWIVPIGGFSFFIWFGLGGEALAVYKAAFYRVVAPFGIKPKPQGPPVSRWQNTQQLVSNTSSMPARSHGGITSLPDLEVLEEKTQTYDVESGKVRVV